MNQIMHLKWWLLFFVLTFTLSAQATLRIEHWQTSDGSQVYFVENHDLPMIDVSTNFSAGSAYDRMGKSGVASITRYMMSLGAAGMTEDAISKRLADSGALMSGDFDLDRSSLSLRTLSSQSERDLALDIYLNILQKPDFPETVLAREKTRIISALKESATQPESIANKAFMKALYGNHPYAFDGNGEPETVIAIKRQELIDFYETHYQAKNAVIALIGDMTNEEARRLAEKISSGLPKNSANEQIAPVSYPDSASEQRIPHPATQSHILLGYPGIKRGDPDYFPLYVGNYVLGGGGFVSRLTEEVREKRGLVYSVYSYFMPMAELGPFQIGLQTKKEQSESALKVVHETLDKFIQDGPTEAELIAAKQNILGGFPLRIDSNSKILDYLSVIGFYKLPLTYLDDFNKKVSEVTTAQIKEAFNRRIKTDKLVTVIVGGSQ